jgi:flagellar hook-associated protein 3 FlgL
MRVTDLTKQNSILNNIGARGGKLQDLQDNVSSGRRINTLSDDPVGATQAQDFRTSISYMETLQQNIQDNFVWLDRTESEIANIGDFLRRAKTLILAQANASADDTTRRVTGEELKAIIEGITQAGNSRIGKLYIFSGSATFNKPLQPNEIVQPAQVQLLGAEGEVMAQGEEMELARFEGHSSKAYKVRITKEGPIGRAHYRVSDDGGETWSREQTLLADNEVFNPDSAPSDKVVLKLNVPSAAAAAAAEGGFVFPVGLEFEYAPNPPLEYRGNDDKRMVQTGEGILLPLNVTAREIFFGGTDGEGIDVVGLMFALQRALDDNDQEGLQARIDDLDQAFEQVLETRANIGAVRKEMDTRLDKLNDRELSKTRQLSDVEDLDLPAALVEMNLADVRNRAALDTSARLIEPSLLNFLR